MKNVNNTYRFVIAAGGTGGHLFPAIAVAQEIRKRVPDSEILFIGTKDKIESREVPRYGFDFKHVRISGFQRKNMAANILFPVKLVISVLQAFFMLLRFKPDAAIGGGAYVSFPVITAASFLGAKVFLMEQNSYPGAANRFLEKKAEKIFTAFEVSEKYFRDSSKLLRAGNPVRQDISLTDREIAVKAFGLEPAKKVLLILGGSLGARSINNAVKKNINSLTGEGIQVLWQCGKLYYDEFKGLESENVKVKPFIEKMEDAYSAADLVVTRAGATTIAELSGLGLPALFIPSPNVAENHQYKNAEALIKDDAAVLLEDNKAGEELADKVKEIIKDENKLKTLGENIRKHHKENAAGVIVDEIMKHVDNEFGTESN